MKKREINILLGNRIKELRETRGLSQAALANKCLKSVETISNFERGKTIPSVMTLVNLARVLGVEVHSFFEFSKQTDKKTKSVSLVESRVRLLSVDDQEFVVMMIESLCKRHSKKHSQK